MVPGQIQLSRVDNDEVHLDDVHQVVYSVGLPLLYAARIRVWVRCSYRNNRLATRQVGSVGVVILCCVKRLGSDAQQDAHGDNTQELLALGSRANCTCRVEVLCFFFTHNV